MSERTTSDEEFVHLFSPKILERLPEDCLAGAVHIFRSPPGGGKTTILRAFTPNALRAFWHAKPTQVGGDSYRQLISRGVLDENLGPQLLGVFLSCAAGYADLPPGASSASEGMFRALLDCRIVLRSLRSLADLIAGSTAELGGIELEYDAEAKDITSIPQYTTATEMIVWAESREREIYAQLDSVANEPGSALSNLHLRFEGGLWLQAVRFKFDGKPIAPSRLLMIDDVQKLRKTQRSLLIDELVAQRPRVPVWLASRDIAFADGFLSQGVREGRDIREYPLEEFWSNGRSQQFIAFAQNILDRRFALQTSVPGGSFAQYLADHMNSSDLEDYLERAISSFQADARRYQGNVRYSRWIPKALERPPAPNIDALINLYATRILIFRDEASRQMSLELTPLTTEDLAERDNSSVKGAAEIFLTREHRVPYYYGLERLCTMATGNVEELLSLAAALYEGMKAKQVVRRQTQPQLSPREQDKRLRDAAARKFDFIPRGHSKGTHAQRLLNSIGLFCRERTFQPTAPYAAGVTGVRLSNSEITKLRGLPKPADPLLSLLAQVLFECVAENLLTSRESSPSTGREGGRVFYLNRTLCAHYGLPLQYGGWQDVTVQRFVDWMENGLQPSRKLA